MDTNLLAEAYKDRAPLLNSINAASPWHLLHRRITDHKLRQLFSEARVLDLASGTGITGISLAERGCEVTLVDTLPDMCRIAESSVPDFLRDRVKVICSDVCSFRDTTPASFDVVVCTQALNFIAEPEKLFATAAYALKPGGLFYFDIDTAYRWTIIEALAGNIRNALEIAEHGVDRERNVVGAPYFFYSRSCLLEHLTKTGFVAPSVSGMLFAVPFLHLFHISVEFLRPEQLHPSVQRLISSDVLLKLQNLEEQLSSTLPIDSAGYHIYVARRSAV